MADPQVIASSVACVKCGYDLRGLDVTGKCPECGTDTARTVPQCPRCASKQDGLVALMRFGDRAGVWTCAMCRGVGFEPGKLKQALTERLDASTSVCAEAIDLASRTAVNCGKCRVPAKLLAVDGAIMIDRCEGCGFIWLDWEEFPAVAAYVRRLVGRRTLPQDLESILHDPVALRQRLSVGTNLTPNLTAAAIIDVVIGLVAAMLS